VNNAGQKPVERRLKAGQKPAAGVPTFLKPVRPTGSAGGLAAGVGQALSPANPPAFSRRQAILIFTA